MCFVFSGVGRSEQAASQSQDDISLTQQAPQSYTHRPLYAAAAPETEHGKGQTGNGILYDSPKTSENLPAACQNHSLLILCLHFFHF